MYAIVDVETTGISAKTEKITEIAIIIHDGEKEIERFQTLVNPEKNIPYRITQLTGINNQMVATAPKFFEIAKKIIRLTEGKTLVGHNVAFDYNFLKAEFGEFNYDFQRKTLCTVKMSRKAFPGLPSYSLPRLTQQLGIPHNQKHRAEGDCDATTRVFEAATQQLPELLETPSQKLPKALGEEQINTIPDTTGVYYFLDSSTKIIYIGKSVHLRQRIRTHLNNHSTQKSVEMIDNIANVKYIETGSELIALLLESEEIKKYRPIYNRAQLRSVFSYALYLEQDQNGYFDLTIGKIESMRPPLTTFSSLREAKDYAAYLVETYDLCLNHCSLGYGAGACFNYQVHKCAGACCGKESPEDYNHKVRKAVDRMRYKHSDFFLIEPGRNEEEYGLVEVKTGAYYGFGYIHRNDLKNRLIREKSIIPGLSNRDSNGIVQSWLRNKNYEMIIND